MKKPGDGRLGKDCMVVVGFTIDPAVREVLRQIAQNESQRVSGLVREMVLDALKRREEQRKEQRKEQTALAPVEQQSVAAAPSFQ